MSQVEKISWLLCPACGCDRFKAEGDSEVIYLDCEGCDLGLEGKLSNVKVVGQEEYIDPDQREVVE